MSGQEEITIHHLVIHVMDKEQHQAANITLSPDEKPVQEATKKLISDLNDRYKGRAGKGYGKFEEDRDSYPMGNIVTDYFNGDPSFYDTSIRMVNHLSNRAEDEQMSTGGFVVISHMSILDNQYLLVAILNSVTGSAIKDFDVESSEYLDIAKLRVAGRIDLTAWQAGRERYISFLKGQNSVAGYFKKFLGCNDVLIAKKETEKLRDALREFAITQGFDSEEKENFLNRAHGQLKDLNKNGLPFEPNSFANELWPTAPEELLSVLANEELQLSEGFVPDGNVIRELVSFKAKTKHWSLKFDRAALLEGSVIFDQDNDRLILLEIPDTLLAELVAECGEEDD
ncbi:nucleoid-associated protein [Erwinia persicina]|uniref:nucleoid-associated protein n=1 Tax=Erwinia persicina TaxID=55211 RepID=UPI002106006B|nr:nucleoid-associated protein [Erwinia persicina]MCQ4105178.1 nucleoid-associated protein [Erwinia persicina]UTX11390.1 nucleoid-associated protein [Erwinia persicina]